MGQTLERVPLDAPILVLLDSLLNAMAKNLQHRGKVLVRNRRHFQVTAHCRQIGQNLERTRNRNRVILSRHHINQTRQNLTQHNGRMLVGDVGAEFAQGS